MASIQKRGKSYQYAVSRMMNGRSKPIRKGGYRTKKEARLAAAEVELQLGKGGTPYLKPAPIDRYFDKWVNLYKHNVSETTKLHYQYTSKIIREYFGSKPLQSIKRHDYQLFLNDYGANKSKETVEKLNSHIRSCVKDSIEEGIIQHDFTRKAVLTWGVPLKNSWDKHLNYQESIQLIREIYKKLVLGLEYYLLLLGLTSGMRFAEMIGLTRDDFDFHKNTITVNKTWGYKKRSEKGFASTKNEQSNRIIRMDKTTMTAFNYLFKVQPCNDYGLVFYDGESIYKVISNTNANRLLKTILAELGIKPITLHGLRHTHASILLYKALLKLDVDI